MSEEATFDFFRLFFALHIYWLINKAPATNKFWYFVVVFMRFRNRANVIVVKRFLLRLSNDGMEILAEIP